MSQQEKKHRWRRRVFKKAQKHFIRFRVKQALKNNDIDLFLLDIVRWYKRLK